MPEVRRQHFISRFYLKNFVSDRNKPYLFVVDFHERKTFTPSPSNVALENDFHTITTPGEEPDAVEKRLAKFEAEVAPAFARIIKAASLDNYDDASLVLFFATLLLVKGPSMRNILNDFANTLMSKITKREAADPVAWEHEMQRSIADGILPLDFDTEQFRQQILNDVFKVGLSTEMHLSLEFDNAIALCQQFVLTRQWNIYKATAGQFVTCDRPAVLMWADPKNRGPVGLGLLGTRFLFPLSSEIAISGGFELENAMIEIDSEEVAKINGHIILNANRQIYARDTDFEYLLPHNQGMKRGSDLLNDEFAQYKADEAKRL